MICLKERLRVLAVGINWRDMTYCDAAEMRAKMRTATALELLKPAVTDRSTLLSNFGSNSYVAVSGLASCSAKYSFC